MTLGERTKRYNDTIDIIWNKVQNEQISKETFSQLMKEFFDFGVEEGQIVFQKIRSGYDFEIVEPPNVSIPDSVWKPYVNGD
jgi:hypothetical protein